MNFWSIRSCFIFEARSASRYWNVGHVNTWSSGSIARCCSSLTLPRSSAGAHEHLAERARVDEAQVAALLEREHHVGVRRHAPPGRSRAGTARSCRSARPARRRSRASCSRYLPRRSTLVTLRPTRREVKSLRVLWRRITRIAFFELLTSASLMRRPTTSFSRSRRITSTSGSSTWSPLTIPAAGAAARRCARTPPRRPAARPPSWTGRCRCPSARPPRSTVAVNSFSWSGPRSSSRYSGIARSACDASSCRIVL